MKTPSCPSCGAGVLWRGLRTDKSFARKGSWYQWAGHCRNCSVRLRSRGGGLFWTSLFLLVIANGLGAHRAVHEGGGYAGLAVYYIAWLAVMVTLAARIKYVPQP